mmetsp:Transcript_13170/g.24649  ORF Transcript_13170/g.24649 Transcript_13170/m.24649 type:complete len:188 (+) Transcript_13170:965-1528(+)
MTVEFPLRTPSLSRSVETYRSLFKILEGAHHYSYDQFAQDLYARSVDNIGYYDALQKLVGVAKLDEGRLFLQADHEGGLYMSSDEVELKGETVNSHWFERFSESKKYEVEVHSPIEFDLKIKEKPPYSVFSVRQDYNEFMAAETQPPEGEFTHMDEILPLSKLPEVLANEWKEVQLSPPTYEDIEDD